MTIRLPWQGADTPCAILDILRGCNARCAYCLVKDAPHMKSLDEIKTDFMTLMKLRRLQSVMISGGEPTLHPELLEVVRFCASHHVKVILLTNGILLDNALAVSLKDAGCSMCFMHIQTLQARPDVSNPTDVAEVSALRHRKGAIARQAGMIAGFCETLQASDKNGIGNTLCEFFDNDIFTHLLVTTARSMEDFDKHDGMDDVAIDELVSRFRAQGLVPFATLSGKLNMRQPRWFSFHVVESVRRDGTVSRRISLKASVSELVVMWLRRLWIGHYEFVMPVSSNATLHLRLLLNAITRLSVRNFLFAMASLRKGEKLRFRNVALETPPYRMKDGRIEYCADCPGAVLKEGKLKPLCLVDIEM